MFTVVFAVMGESRLSSRCSVVPCAAAIVEGPKMESALFRVTFAVAEQFAAIQNDRAGGQRSRIAERECPACYCDVAESVRLIEGHETGIDGQRSVDQQFTRAFDTSAA